MCPYVHMESPGGFVIPPRGLHIWLVEFRVDPEGWGLLAGLGSGFFLPSNRHKKPEKIDPCQKFPFFGNIWSFRKQKISPRKAFKNSTSARIPVKKFPVVNPGTSGGGGLASGFFGG